MQSTGVPRSVYMMDELKNVDGSMLGFVSEIGDLKSKLPEQ